MQGRQDRLSTIVWAKLGGFPWWPAVVTPTQTSPDKLEDDKVLVRFIGENTQYLLGSSYVSPSCIKDFEAFKSQYSNTKLRVRPSQHLKVSIEYAMKFVGGELDVSNLSQVNETILKSTHTKRPVKPATPSVSSGSNEDSSCDSDFTPHAGSTLMNLAEHACILSQSQPTSGRVLGVVKCCEVDLSPPEPFKSFEVIQQEAQSSFDFINAYAEFLEVIKSLEIKQGSVSHVLPEPIQRNLSQLRSCDRDDAASLTIMRSLRDFVGDLDASNQLLSHSKLIASLKHEASLLSPNLRAALIKDSTERLFLLLRSQLVTPLSSVTSQTCRELVELLMARNFSDKDARQIACTSEAKLRSLDPSQGRTYQARLAELKETFSRMTVETFRRIRNSISITQDS
jgi:hypothetical protein